VRFVLNNAALSLSVNEKIEGSDKKSSGPFGVPDATRTYAAPDVLFYIFARKIYGTLLRAIRGI
jgi:hypothetical protein